MSTESEQELEMYSEIYAYFELRGDFEPDVITGILGIVPTKICRKGDQNPWFRVKSLYSQSYWSLESGLDHNRDLDDHVNAVMAKLEGAWDTFVRVSAEHEAWLNCVIYSHGGDRPAIGLERGVLKRLAELNAQLDVDLHVLP